MKDLLNTTTLKRIKGETIRLLVSQMWGAITRLENMTLSRVPSNILDLVLNAICTAYSKEMLMDITVGMNPM